MQAGRNKLTAKIEIVTKMEQQKTGTYLERKKGKKLETFFEKKLHVVVAIFTWWTARKKERTSETAAAANENRK